MGKFGILFRVVACAADPLSAAKLLFHGLSRYGLNPLEGRPYSVKLRLAGNTGRITLTGTLSDLFAINDVFLVDSYETGSKTPANILDLGANIGLSILWFRLKYPDAHIVAYEPGTAAFTLLQKNFGNDSHVTLHKKAVAGERGEMTFYEAKRTTLSSVIYRHPESVETKVPTITLDDAIGTSIPDLLKIDVEGAEFDIFAASSLLSRIPAITGELHPYKAKRSASEALDLLSSTHTIETKPIPPGKVILFSAVKK